MKTPSSIVSDSPSTTLRESFDSLCASLIRLKKSVGQRLMREFRQHIPVALIQRALADAEKAAYETEFPHLVYPLLAEEKVRLMAAAIMTSPFRSHNGTLRSAA
jgi:hypothetical protein